MTRTAFTFSKKSVVSQAVTEKEEAVICIPPHSWKIMKEYSVAPNVMLTCNKKTDKPRTSVEVLQPQWLRQQMAGKFQQLVKNYTAASGENAENA